MGLIFLGSPCIMTLWTGNGEVLTSSSQLQLDQFRKLNDSGHELFISKIFLTVIDWNFLRIAPLPIHNVLTIAIF